ncbi:MAG: hypothetical protein VB957_15365 [Pseudomonadales bacterium]
MTIHLRQICLVAEKLAPVIDDLTNILGIQSCYIDPGVEHFGLENNLMAVGTNFLEVVAPIQENTAGGRYLERRKGDGGYMVITQADSTTTQQAARQRALDLGVRIAHESQRGDWNLCQLHPQDMEAAFLELESDAQNDFVGYWHPVGGTGWEDKVDQNVTLDFIGVELQSVNPVTLAEKWAKVIGTDSYLEGESIVVPLNNVKLRFVAVSDGRGPGLGGLDIKVADREHILRESKKRNCYVSDDQVIICGTRFYLSV